jgi:iron complex transport system substrate-binding protein
VVGITDSVTEEPNFFRKLKDKPLVGKWNNPSFENIVEVAPEVVIAYSKHPGPELEEKLEPTSIRLARIDCYKIESLDSDVKTLGAMVDKEKEAEEFVKFYREYLKIIENRTSNLLPGERVKVYVESYSDYTSVAHGSGGHQICAMAGGINIAADEPVPYPKISAEWLLKKNPQIIIKAVTNSSAPSGYGVDNTTPLEKLRAEIMNRPGFSEIDAVKNDKVYLISNEIWTGPRAVIGIIQMAKWFYPELFKDLSPESVHREYLERFLQLE